MGSDIPLSVFDLNCFVLDKITFNQRHLIGTVQEPERQKIGQNTP